MSAEGILIKIAAVGAAEAAAEVDGVTVSLDRMGGAAATTKAELGAGKSGLMGALTSMKTLMAGLGIGAAIKEFAGFQAQQERLHTQTGATQAEVGRTSKAILGMAASVGEGPGSLAEAFYHIESAGYRGKKAIDALRISAMGAKIGGAELTETTTAMPAVMVAGFHGVDTLRKAMGELNATVGAGDMTMDDLNSALGTGLLATMKTMGLQVKDVGAALAVLGDNNIRGAQAATRLRMGLMQLVHPSETVASAMGEIGLKPLELAEEMRKPNGLLKMLELIHEKLGPLRTDAEKTKAANILGGIFGGGRNSSAILTLLTQLPRLQKKYEMLAKGGKDFNKDWIATTHTLQFLLDQIKALGEVALIKLGSSVNWVVHQIENLISAFKKGKTWAVLVVGALAGLAAVVTIIEAITVATRAWEITMALFGALDFWMLIPVLLGMLVMLIVKSKAVREAFVSAWHWIEKAAATAFDWIKGHWPLLAAILLFPITGPIGIIVALFHTQLLGAAKAVWGWIKGAWHELGGILTWPFREAEKVVHTVATSIVHAISWAVKEVQKLLGKILGPLKDVEHFGGGLLHGGLKVAGDVGKLFGFADGGFVNTSGSYLVGERGPEIVHMPRGTYVQPNNEIGSPGVAAGGDITINLQVDGKVLSRSVVRQGLMQQSRR